MAFRVLMDPITTNQKLISHLGARIRTRVRPSCVFSNLRNCPDNVFRLVSRWRRWSLWRRARDAVIIWWARANENILIRASQWGGYYLDTFSSKCCLGLAAFLGLILKPSEYLGMWTLKMVQWEGPFSDLLKDCSDWAPCVTAEFGSEDLLFCSPRIRFIFFFYLNSSELPHGKSGEVWEVWAM